jgi:hypothetical protein
VDFAVDFSSDFSGKMEGFVQNGLKIFKKFRQSQQSTTWPIREPATVYFFREVDQLLTFKKKNHGFIDFSKKNRNSQCIVKSRLSTSRLDPGKIKSKSKETLS